VFFGEIMKDEIHPVVLSMFSMPKLNGREMRGRYALYDSRLRTC